MIGRRFVTAAIVLAGLTWAGTIAAAYQAVRRFETTPGFAADASSSWPARSTIPRGAGRWSLVMLVHPHCSCSRASIQELQAILEKAPHTLHASVLVYRPSEFPAGWERTDVYESASKLPRTNVIVDRDGREAAVFGGFTSGQTFLYDATGHLRFAGGITSLRGHAGLNRGRADIIQIASAGQGSGKHPVFGCAIATPGKGNGK
jgi:hypothetical protein